MRSFRIQSFEKGLNTAQRADKLKEGEAVRVKNWLAREGRVELSGGAALVGSTTFAGAVTGCFSAFKADGTEVVWMKVGAKLYAKDGSADWAECGTDLFGAAAADERCSFVEWKGIAGTWVFVSSPRSGLWKIPVANPTSYVSYPDCGFRGNLAIIGSRLWVWSWPTTGGSLDLTGYQLSCQPEAALSDYDSKMDDAFATGDGANAVRTGTLDFKSAAATRNCFSVSVHPAVSNLSLTVTGITKGATARVTVTESIAGVITSPATFEVTLTGVVGMTEINNLPALATYVSDHQFDLAIDSSAFGAWGSGGTVWKCGGTLTDDGSGNLASTDGSAGTVNYATGAVSVTLHAVPPNASPIVAQYLWEDSADGGLADFLDVSATAGDGLAHYLPQPGVGAAKGAYPYGQKAYCLHEQGVYEVSFDDFGDPAANLIFRRTSGPSSAFGAAAAAEGIYYVDDASGDAARIRLIQTVSSGNAVYVDNRSVSDALDLAAYDFSEAQVMTFGDLVLVACSEGGEGNDTLLVYDRRYKSFVTLSYPANCLTTVGSKVAYGDTGLGALYTALDGTDWLGETQGNGWDSGDHDLGYDGLKRSRQLWVEGDVSIGQELVFSASLDGSPFVEVGRIAGTDAQVDSSPAGAVGSAAIGSEPVGDGDASMPWRFAKELPWNAKFRKCTLRVEAVGDGDASVDTLAFHDVRLCGGRLPEKYRSN